MPVNPPPPAGSISRRRFLQITAAAGAVYLGGRGLRHLTGRERTISETRLLMGTLVNLAIVGADEPSARRAIEATFVEMGRLISIFDWRRPESPVARLNRNSTLDRPPADLTQLLDDARHYSELTGGAFDVTVLPLLEAVRSGTDPGPALQLVDYRRLTVSPQALALQPGMGITLDGIAKGRVVDGAAATLTALGFANILVEAGGDLLARGGRRDGTPWRIGISHPRQSAAPLDVLTLSGRAAATSGDYQHAFSADFTAHHIVDPRRGVSPPALAAATVLAPTAMAADALSTALLVLGPEAGMALIDRLPHTAALLVTKDMDVIRSAAFPAA